MKGKPAEQNQELDIWRLIPPEEKFALLAKAQSKGVFAAAVTIIIGCTITVALKMSWIMWGTIICSPFVFQLAAGKAWRTLRPRAMLEYLAARSASRRYAFSTKARDLSPRVMFRGHLEEIYGDDNIHEALEAIIENTKEAEVWVTLFGDAVIMVTEKLGGAELKLASMLDDKIEVTSHSEDGKDYSQKKALFIEVKNKVGQSKRYRLTSQFPAALVVFEKKLLSQKNAYKPSFEPIKELPLEAGDGSVDDDKFNSLFSF